MIMRIGRRGVAGSRSARVRRGEQGHVPGPSSLPGRGERSARRGGAGYGARRFARAVPDGRRGAAPRRGARALAHRAAPRRRARGGPRADAEHDVRLDAGPCASAACGRPRCEAPEPARGSGGGGFGAGLGGGLRAPHCAVRLFLGCVGVRGLREGRQPLGAVGRGAHRGVRRCGDLARSGDVASRGGRGGALQRHRARAGQRRAGVRRRHRHGRGGVAPGACERARPRGAVVRAQRGRVSHCDARWGGAGRGGSPGGVVQRRRRRRAGEPAASRQPWVGGGGGAHRGHRRCGGVVGRCGDVHPRRRVGAHARCGGARVRGGRGARRGVGHGHGAVALGGERGPRHRGDEPRCERERSLEQCVDGAGVCRERRGRGGRGASGALSARGGAVGAGELSGAGAHRQPLGRGGRGAHRGH